MTRVLSVFLLAGFLMGISSCSSEKDNIEPGSICTIENGEGEFRLVKVLEIDNNKVQLMVFKNVYPQRPAPASIEPDDLELDNGAVETHQPNDNQEEMTRAEFDSRKPVVVAFEKVVKEELKGT